MLKIRKFKQNDFESIRNLLSQLTDKKLDLDMDVLMAYNNIEYLVLANENNILAFGSVAFYPVPSKGLVATIQDLVVDKSLRGQGWGEKILKNLIEIAKDRNVIYINLTSKKERIVARNLYKKLGFEIVETDIFKLEV